MTDIPTITSSNDYYDLGTYNRKITTSSTDAQLWFTRGLIWCYGFNHEESVSCFQRAIDEDANCAMAYWGLAYSLGPNYNKPWEFFDRVELGTNVESANHATRTAKEKGKGATSGGSDVEKALIEALQYRYPQDKPVEDCTVWNTEYADAMKKVYDQFADDLDVAALYADALMNLTPWALWDIRTGEPAPGARTTEVKAVLDRAIAQAGGESHPGLLHLYIHLMEMSGRPELAMPAADLLRGLVPDSGHLNHMPTHLDILCGDYRRAIASNSDAIRADEKFLARNGGLNFYTLYRCHDYHFRIYAAMFAGQFRVAMDTVERLEKSLPEELLRVESPPMADWLESFLTMRMHVLVRFGQWEDILKLQLPEDQGLYCTTVAMIHYARAIAMAALGKVEEADVEYINFKTAQANVKSSRTLFNNTCIDILAVASAMLNGEIEYRRGDYESAFSNFLQAIKLEDSLPYDEPWGWMQPTRHAYGALLLEQGEIEAAAAVYAADLGIDEDTLPRALQHPNNVWSLHGYHECLVKLNRHAEARILKKQLSLAEAVADIPISSSCFCRQNNRPQPGN